MNILVIGNGFELAHGLPTGYPDFLWFCKMIKAVYSVEKNSNVDEIWGTLEIKLKSDVNVNRLRTKFSELYSIGIVKTDEKKETYTVIDEFYDNIDNNIRIEYFLQNPMY